MADIIQTVDLTPVLRAVQQVSGNLDSIAQRVENSNNKIAKIDEEVGNIKMTVNSLIGKFRQMLDKQEKSYAATEIVRVRQELQTKFGHYETVRKNMLGILQANDLALVKEETISSCSEELMLAAPGYWLAPALVALAAWISDNPALANRAVAEAIKRDEEKTYLLFALICRRAGRLEASSQWLGRYFELQDAHNMKDTVVNMIDAYSNRLFGSSRDSVCEDSIANWMRDIKQTPGFMKQQIDQWTGIFEANLPPVDSSEYKALCTVCEESQQLLYAYARVKNMHNVLGMFVDIMNADERKESLIEAVDNCLYSLVKNYDAEESPLKEEEQYYAEVIRAQGDTERARAVVAAKRMPADKTVNFAEQLSKAAMSSGEYGVSATFRKTSLRLLEKEKVISTSFKKYAQDTLASLPASATFRISDWRVKIKSSTTGQLATPEATVKHYETHVDKAVQEAQSKLKPLSVPGLIISVIALAVMIICAVFASSSTFAAVVAVIAAIGVIAGVVIIVRKALNIKKQKQTIYEAGETEKKTGADLIKQAFEQYLAVTSYITADGSAFGADTYQIESLK